MRVTNSGLSRRKHGREIAMLVDHAHDLDAIVLDPIKDCIRVREHRPKPGRHFVSGAFPSNGWVARRSLANRISPAS